MHIVANMRPTICIKGRLMISSKVVAIWVVTRERGSRQKYDKGERGSTIGARPVTHFLNGPKPISCKESLVEINQ